MTAKEYYEKYHDRLSALDYRALVEAAYGMYLEMFTEAHELSVKRNAKTTQASVAIIKEFNQKYNAVCALFDKNHEPCPIK